MSPLMYPDPLPSHANGTRTTAPPSGMEYTWPPLFSSHPATMRPAMSRSLLLYASILKRLAAVFTHDNSAIEFNCHNSSACGDCLLWCHDVVRAVRTAWLHMPNEPLLRLHTEGCESLHAAWTKL